MGLSVKAGVQKVLVEALGSERGEEVYSYMNKNNQICIESWG